MATRISSLILNWQDMKNNSKHNMFQLLLLKYNQQYIFITVTVFGILSS